MSSIVEVLVNSSACEPCDLPVAGALTYLEWYDKYAEIKNNTKTFTALSEREWRHNNNKKTEHNKYIELNKYIKWKKQQEV